MSDYDRFPYQLKSAALAPEPIRTALQRELVDGREARLLIHTPPSETSRARHGPIVLAVTPDGWIAVEATGRGETRVARSDFAHTIRVQMTGVLLCGVFRIDFAEAGVVRSVAMEYNTVMERLYRQALQLLLHGIAGVPAAPPIDRRATLPLLEPFPLKFLNSTWNDTPPDEHLRAVVYWPAAVVKYNRWFQRELAPEAMFALSERELIFISEEKSPWSLRVGRENKYGDVATYLPLSRLREFRFRAGTGPLGQLELTVGAAGANETLGVEFPAGHRAVIEQLVDRAFCERSNASVSAAHPNE